MNEIRFGVIGLGLMGREFASAAARWLHLDDPGARPVITAVCDPVPAARTWFRERVPSVAFDTEDYRELLERDDVDAVYCAVPHHLHERIYLDALRAGKHLMGEKPFGIDRAAYRAIRAEIDRRPEQLVRCSSEFPFYPGVVAMVRALQRGDAGRILRAEASFLHSSDLNPGKPINWKRRVATNGAYGCMGDLGMHVLHVPLRLGWRVGAVRAQLSNVMTERPDGEGGTAACETWDNATLLTRAEPAAANEAGAYDFPLLLRTDRIAPGETNTWRLAVHGTRASFEYSTKHPKTLRRLRYEPGGEQAWEHLDLGYASAYGAITGGIFEFGFPDAVQQMWAAFCDELAHGREGMRQPFHCATPDEVGVSHDVFTAALAAHADANPGATSGAAAG